VEAGWLLLLVGLLGGGGDLFLSSLYIREGFLKYLEVDGTKRRDVLRWTTRHLIPGGMGGREELLGEEGILVNVLDMFGGFVVVCGGGCEVLILEGRMMNLSVVVRSW
jgi:hypothetical protein